MIDLDLDRRASGLLLHPTSLPGPHGSGDLGDEAHRFVDFLADTGLGWWQMLPLGPVGYANSPYSAQSSFAGNSLLISPERLAEDGLLDMGPLPPPMSEERVDFGRVTAWREGLLRAAHQRMRSLEPRHALRRDLDAFVERSRLWLEDFALYRALKRAHGERAWIDWEPEVRDRRPAALDRARRDLAADVEFARFKQWAFDRQWRALRAHAHRRGVGLIGDIPIFIAPDSCDVWAHRELFFLDETGAPSVVAGVPPDYFSATGQRWGNPLYRWDRLAETGYAWWVDRVEVTLHRVDAIRLDHFIGFQRYWEIPAECPTAVEGRWLPGPADALFEAIRRRHGSLPLVAEDLGLITPEVIALRDRLGLPGIKILQFGFSSDPANDFLPHNWQRRAVAYTGTHDNDTTVGWYNERAGRGSTRTAEQVEAERTIAREYLGLPADGSGDGEIHWAMIRCLLASVANLTIIPVQDLLGLGSEARMNLPGTEEGNWEWRLRPGALDERIGQRLARLVHIYGRSRPAPASAPATVHKST